MQIKNIKPNALNSSFFTKLMKILFLFVFSFTLFLQQLHALSFLSNSENLQKKFSVLLQVPHANSLSLSLLPPNNSKPSVIEMELEEDDDHHNDGQEYCNKNSKNFLAEGLVYNCILRIRYLQLFFSVYHQPVVSFFILHHSWKNYIV